MKCTFLFLLNFLFIASKCHRISPEIVASENVNLDVNESDNSGSISTKSGKNVGNRVYLEDVLFALKNHNWTAQEFPCLNQTLRLLRSLQNFTLWSVWEWDSISSETQGILYGDRYELGNFDECMNTPWSSSHKDLRTQYCVADITLERTDGAARKPIKYPVQPYQSALDYIQHRPPHMRSLNVLTWGVCVPAVCTPQSVERLFVVMLARSHLGPAGLKPLVSLTEPCQRADETRQFDGPFYAFLVFSISAFVIALACTFLNNGDSTNPSSVKKRIIEAFCIKKNAKNLLEVKKDGIEVLYGIRFLTISFIVLDHQLGIFNSGPISNGQQVDQDILAAPGMLVLHDDLFVDTFFFMSAFLTATIFRKFKKFPNPIFMILKRYVRLIVAFAVVTFYLAAVYPYTGSGPLWNRAIDGDTKQCRKNWWLNMLMISNYVDNENICLVISWYIPCDFHFFVVTVLLYWMYQKVPKLSLACAGVLAVTSVVVPGVVNYINQLPAVQLFTYEFVKNPRGSEQFHLTYIKSHTRFAAYVVGFFSGYYFASGNIKRISKKWSVLGACGGVFVMFAVMIGGTTYLWRQYHPIEGALYAATNRPLWACGLAMLVLSCSFGSVPIVKSFLSWYPWGPLSRLSYGLYLTHAIIITRNVFVTRNPPHNDYIQHMTAAAGVIFWGCLWALIIWLLMEAPVNNLLMVALKPRGGETKPPVLDIVDNETQNTAATSASSSSGHLARNMPANVHVSFKL